MNRDKTPEKPKFGVVCRNGGERGMNIKTTIYRLNSMSGFASPD
jgi:hypothetical protein